MMIPAKADRMIIDVQCSPRSIDLSCASSLRRKRRISASSLVPSFSIQAPIVAWCMANEAFEETFFGLLHVRFVLPALLCVTQNGRRTDG